MKRRFSLKNGIRARHRARLGLAIAVGLAMLCAACAGPTQLAPAHRVRPGDTLHWIATSYGVPVETVARSNGLLDADRIVVGQEIRLPVHTRLVYRAGPGETLRQIAKRHLVPVERVARRNRIADPDAVIAGHHVLLPREARLMSPPWMRGPMPSGVSLGIETVGGKRAGKKRAGEKLVVRAETHYREARFESALEEARRAREHFADRGTRPDLQARAAFIEGCSLVAFGETAEAVAVFANARSVAPDYQPPAAWLSPQIFALYFGP